MQAHLDHVALVVRRLEAVIDRLRGIEAGPIESFPAEGTREVYLGSGTARLLLMEPLRPDGPYGRAIAKRGPGLHHVALTVPDLQSFLADVRGWLLVPAAIAEMQAARTAWLARPGVATLLEVVEGEPPAGPAVVEQIELPGDLPVEPRPALVASDDHDVWLTIGGTRHSVRDLTADG